MGPIQSGINQIVNTAAFGFGGVKFKKDIDAVLKKKTDIAAKSLKEGDIDTHLKNINEILKDEKQAEKFFKKNPEYAEKLIGEDAQKGFDELINSTIKGIKEKYNVPTRENPEQSLEAWGANLLNKTAQKPSGNDMTKDVMTKKMKQAEDMEKMKETLKNPEQEIPLEIEPEIGNQMATEAIETRLNQNEKFEELKKEVEISEYDVDDSNALDEIFGEKQGRKLSPYELKRDSVRKELFNLQNVTTTSEGIGKFYEKRINPIEKELKAIRKNENYEDIDRILKEHFNLDRETFLKDEFMNDIAYSLYKQPLDKIVKRIEYFVSKQPGYNKEGMFFYDLYDPIIRQALYYEVDNAETYLNVLTGGNK